MSLRFSQQLLFVIFLAETFLSGLCTLIGKLFGEKESDAETFFNKWLENEAAAQENINKAGTFR